MRVSMSRNSVIHKILCEFLQPLRCFRIITRVSQFYRGFLYIWFWDFVGLDFLRFPDLSSTISDTGTGEMSLLGASSLSRTGISPTVGEEGEDEEDEEE